MELSKDQNSRALAARLNDACMRGSLVEAEAVMADLAPIELLLLTLDAGFVSLGYKSSFKPENLRRWVAEACGEKINGWTWSHGRSVL